VKKVVPVKKKVVVVSSPPPPPPRGRFSQTEKRNKTDRIPESNMHALENFCPT
jgi:hypothetical protein